MLPVFPLIPQNRPSFVGTVRIQMVVALNFEILHCELAYIL